MTPSTTPLAITIPISPPSLSCMKQSAKKPAIVVTELDVMEVKVA